MLISKFMTLSTGKQIHKLPKISRSKDSQRKKLGQFMKLNIILFFKNHTENETGRLDLMPDLLSLFKKALFEVKAGVQHHSFNIFWLSSTWTYKKSKLYKIADR